MLLPNRLKRFSPDLFPLMKLRNLSRTLRGQHVTTTGAPFARIFVKQFWRCSTRSSTGNLLFTTCKGDVTVKMENLKKIVYFFLLQIVR